MTKGRRIRRRNERIQAIAINALIGAHGVIFAGALLVWAYAFGATL